MCNFHILYNYYSVCNLYDLYNHYNIHNLHNLYNYNIYMEKTLNFSNKF